MYVPSAILGIEKNPNLFVIAPRSGLDTESLVIYTAAPTTVSPDVESVTTPETVYPGVGCCFRAKALPHNPNTTTQILKIYLILNLTFLLPTIYGITIQSFVKGLFCYRLTAPNAI